MMSYTNYASLLAKPNLLDEIDRELATRRLREFVAQAWPVLEPATQFVPGWHIDAICEHLEAITVGQIRNLLITVPPRHMKSLAISVFWPCCSFPSEEAALKLLYLGLQNVSKKWKAATNWRRALNHFTVVYGDRMLDSTHNLKHRALLATLYSTGMRAAEVQQMKTSDVDGPRMLILIRHGKGGRQRYVMLSTMLRDILRAYWRWRRPSDWLFPSARYPERPLDLSGIRLICRHAGRAAGIAQGVHPHLLRHSFASHLLDDGVNLRRIQVLLGHASIKTTAKYLLVSQQALQQTVSPLDRLTLSTPHCADSDGRRR
jgi:integrase/recombinase XerD